MSTTVLPIGTKVAIDYVDGEMSDLNGLTGVVDGYASEVEQMLFGAPADAHYVIVDSTGELVGLESRHITELTEEVAA